MDVKAPIEERRGSMAAVDYFMKIDGIDGESQDAKHKGEIDILSWGFGATQSGTMHMGGGGGAGKVSVKDLHFEMNVNKASPKLFLACAKGDHIKKAVLTARKAGGEQQEYYKITLEDLLVSGYEAGASTTDKLFPTDKVSLNFAKIDILYKEQKPDGSLGGSIETKYDLKANKVY